MASPSPALSNTSNDTTTTATTTNAATAALANIAAAAAAAATPSSITSQPKNLRGLNKPKCIQCGNVARSRYFILFLIIQLLFSRNLKD